MTLTVGSLSSSLASTNASVCHHSLRETAYGVPDAKMCLDTTLCLKYRRRVGIDKTVTYRWRTLQLLPGTDRPSYAGAVVDVLEGLDGQLAVQHEGQIIPTQEAPQRPNILRDFTERSHAYSFASSRQQWPGQTLGRQARAQLDVDVPRDTADGNGAGRVRKVVSPRRRKPTPLQTARWRAVRKAKRKGLSIRGIARELGIHRDTVKRYMNAESPPMSRGRAASTVS